MSDFLRDAIRGAIKRIESLEKEASDLGGRVYSLEGDVKDLEKWREELDPIYTKPRVGICPNCSHEMEYVNGIATCREINGGCGFKHELSKDDPPIATLGVGHKTKLPHGLEMEDLKPLPNDNIYNRSHLARASLLDSEHIADIAPMGEVCCPKCGHKL